MLNENIKLLRKSNGLSQEQLANEMHVVRQTVSKWERGLSVPDSDSLIKLSEILHTSVSVLLGENVEEIQQTELDKISEKLEEINMQFFENKQKKITTYRNIFIAVDVLIVFVFLVLFFMKSSYLQWKIADSNTMVMKFILQSFEWGFVRVAPLIFVICTICAYIFNKKLKICSVI
ncbi:helix-turn-helix domain-containing protein [Finegoldia sp. BIOML-A2]|uniref:helix-turn-helix domain-containing protein n=1 Tax=unclassified Finegoldia TaxID=2619637 RepID=UPI0012AF34CB|nr:MULTISPECIES: helix-turn-helix transcriptional regulator [unclassified Finegoldia]MSA96640.1 helix-turn-helix domain-containing protein [Finegoldia sp. BIOML-A5]MSB00025.1 helix-turn-helix domain-containing protein [Finegoldia sp. BIOML-A2]